MKYLGLHKLLWYVIVVLWTLWEILIVLIIYIIYFIWNLKFPKYVWEETHNRYAIYPNENKTILQTLKRRFNIIK